MAATFNRPTTALPGPDGGHPDSRTNSGVTNSVQQDPGPHGCCQEPGSSLSQPQHPIFARPVFYVHAPPPPPFLQYQWPVPFPYNPFTGFPGMSYGMVIPPPPFPPPPFMDAPAYILPHPPIQPVDYRRFLYPQVHTQGGLQQNPNQTRRIRLPHTAPVTETVNSEVQTELTQRGTSMYDVGWPTASSDSGQGTALNSPCSPGSSSQKRASVEVVNYKLPDSDGGNTQVNEPCTNGNVKQGFKKLPTGTNTAESCITETQDVQVDNDIGQESPLIPPGRDGHCNMWLASSPDSVVPVSSSSQEDGVFKERRISVPDILMSWGGGTPQTMLKVTDRELPQSNRQQSYKPEENNELVNQCSKTKNDFVVSDGIDVNDGVRNPKDGEMLFKILRLPCPVHESFPELGEDEHVELTGSERPSFAYRDELQYSPNANFTYNEKESRYGTDPRGDRTESIPYKMPFSSCQVKRQMNESVWSVESLAPFIPTREWLLQNGMFGAEVKEMKEAENVEPSTKIDNVAGMERRQGFSFPSFDSVPMSENWLNFNKLDKKESPPKKPEMESQMPEISGPELDQCMALLKEDTSCSPTPLLDKIVSTPVNEQENGSSEPEEIILSTGQLIPQNGVDTDVDGASLTAQKMAQVSLLKGNLVDCGIQCNKLQERKCLCEELSSSMGQNGKQPFKYYSDVKKANNTSAETFCISGQVQKKRNGQRRNRGQEQHSSQQEIYNEYSKPGKSKGGNGRNPRH